MKSHTLLRCALILLLLASPAWAETRRVQDLEFDQVLIKGAVKVEISQGDSPELLLRGDGKLLDEEPFYLSGSTLVLGHSRKHSRRDYSGVKFKLSVDEIKLIALKGSADLFLRPIKADALRVSLEGSGDIKAFDISADQLSLELRGSGDLKAAHLDVQELALALGGSGDIHLGKINAEDIEASVMGSGDITVHKNSGTGHLQVNIMGSGDVDFRDLDASVAQVNIIGSGNARLGTLETLQVTIMGSGDVHYRGDAEVSENVMGSGSVRRKK